jgi:hypothetical protein
VPLGVNDVEMASNWCREKIKEVCNLSSSTFWLSKQQIIALLLGQVASLLITGNLSRFNSGKEQIFTI